MRARASPTMTFSSSGSRRSASTVEPTRSAKTAVITRRSSRTSRGSSGDDMVAILPDLPGFGAPRDRRAPGPRSPERCGRPGARATPGGAPGGRGARRGAHPPPRRSCRCPRPARPRGAAPLRSRLLGRDLERQSGGEEREPHVRAVDRTRPARLLHQVFELLAALPARDRVDGVDHRALGGLAAHERCDRERDRETGGPAAFVPVRDGGERRRERESSSGRWAYATPSGAQYITDPLPALTSGPRSSTYARAASVAPSAARESTTRVRFPTSGGSVSSQAMWRASTSFVSSVPGRAGIG